MIEEGLPALLEELARAKGLWHPDTFAARADALDRLELFMLGYHGPAAGGWSDDGYKPAPGEPPRGLIAEAADWTQRLAEANRLACQQLRAEIRSGACRNGDARRRLEQWSQTGREARPDGMEGKYDLLDSLVSALLLDAPEPAIMPASAPERVAYQPTPVRVVLALIDWAGLSRDDTFYDLGSGLGQVCLLVHWLSGAQARGIEIEPGYCRFARRQAGALGLEGVEFIEGDVCQASLAGGTCYFLYTPFTGQTLARALGKLAGEAQQRAIKVAAYGPCAPVVACQPWLKRLAGRGGEELNLYGSC